MTPKVPASETGIATAGIRVARQLRRNSSTTRMTSPMAMARARCTSRSDARMVGVRSLMTFTSMACGIDP